MESPMTNTELLKARLNYSPSDKAVEQWEQYVSDQLENNMKIDEHTVSKWLDTLDLLPTSECEEMFHETLDECVEPFKFGQCSYDASQVLKAIDPIAYREEWLTYWDNILSDDSGDYIQDNEEYIYRLR
jgi:hypothetical protein